MCVRERESEIEREEIKKGRSERKREEARTAVFFEFVQSELRRDRKKRNHLFHPTRAVSFLCTMVLLVFFFFFF